MLYVCVVSLLGVSGCRSHFAYGDQFKVLLRFIVELEMQNFKVSVLEYTNACMHAYTYTHNRIGFDILAIC